MNNVKESLETWGNWARCHLGTEYSTVNITFQEALPMHSSNLKRIDDKEGMLIDAAVAGLKRFDLLAYKLIIAHYVYRVSQNRLAKEIGKAQSYVANLLRIAEAFIAGQIFSYTEIAASA
uniref:Uncharacterized protein n=1 Tax=Anopheles maculatus TaxID=74869 RepID=A0A182SNB4_9DIPT